MTNEKNLREFLKNNETEIPKPANDEFLNIQRKIILERESQGRTSLWIWGPASLTLASLMVAAFFTINHFDSESSEVVNTEIAQMIWNSYGYLDEPMDDPLEEIY